jgi:hypothetical protein
MSTTPSSVSGLVQSLQTFRNTYAIGNFILFDWGVLVAFLTLFIYMNTKRLDIMTAIIITIPTSIIMDIVTDRHNVITDLFLDPKDMIVKFLFMWCIFHILERI